MGLTSYLWLVGLFVRWMTDGKLWLDLHGYPMFAADLRWISHSNHLNILNHKPHADIYLRKKTIDGYLFFSKYKYKVNIYHSSIFHRLCQIDPDRRSEDNIRLVILMVKRFVEGTVDPAYKTVKISLFFLLVINPNVDS